MNPATRPNSRATAITFDVGGTLIRPWPSVGQIYAEVAGRNGLKNLSAARLDQQFRAAWQAEHPFEHTREGWARLVDRTFAGLADTPPSRTFFPELFARFAQPDAWRIYNDVLSTLRELREKRFRLGVISNWDERLRPLLNALRLDSFFEFIVVSCEVGAVKPSPAIFQATLRQFGLPPNEVLHVGDNEQSDVEGAMDVGMRAVRIQRGENMHEKGVIRSLEEIPRVVPGPH